jgi:ribosomal protein S11
MRNNYNINFDLNKFLSDIQLKKNYIKNLKDKASFLADIKEKNYKFLSSDIAALTEKNYKFLSSVLTLKKKPCIEYDFLVNYIIDISFSRSNSFLHVLDFDGNLKFFCSAGCFSYSGKRKIDRQTVLKDFYKTLLKLHFLRNQQVALHLKNVDFNKDWILNKLTEQFSVKVFRIFYTKPHNGCRNQKIRCKKFKKI